MKSAFRYEYWCAMIAAVCLATAAVWPAAAVATAIIAFVVFCAALAHYKLRNLTNLVFLFVAITLLIIVTSTDLWGTWLAMAGLETARHFVLDDYTRAWSSQYVAMAIDAMVLGACCVKWGHHRLVKAEFVLRKPLQCPSIYLAAAFVPLLLNLALYELRFRGLGYEAYQAASQGSYKRILLLVILTHAAFLRLLGGWANLDRRSRVLFGIAICLFLYMYAFLFSTRTNLFVFGVYLYYFYGWRISWKVKTLAVVLILISFGWIANYRSSSYEGIKDVGVAGILEAITIGPEFMLDMVQWAYQDVQAKGPTWGATSLIAAVTPKNPADAYVQEKLPSYADQGGGYGFFYVAEFVMDFGYVGGLFGALFLGMILQKISVMENEMTRLTVLPALLGASFPLLRNVFLMALKAPLYVILFCIVLDRLALYVHHLGEHIEFAELSAVRK
jgi:oligosaccharide repeat unit polymerase